MYGRGEQLRDYLYLKLPRRFIVFYFIFIPMITQFTRKGLTDGGEIHYESHKRYIVHELSPPLVHRRSVRLTYSNCLYLHLCRRLGVASRYNDVVDSCQPLKLTTVDLFHRPWPEKRSGSGASVI